MTTLVTGGSGLLGSEIHFSTGETKKPSHAELNVEDYCQLKRYVQNHRVDRIIHCAALVGGVKVNSERNYDFFQKNLMMNINILDICKEFSLKGSVFILSSCVMPKDGLLPYREESLHLGEPHNTNYGYSYAKRMLQVGSQALWEQYGINTTCIIPCNLYGKKDNYGLESGHVIPNLIHKCFLAKQNKTDFVVWGSGNPEREFMYAEDLAKIITHENLPHIGSMIVSPGISHTIRKTAEIISENMKFSGKIVFDIEKPEGILRKPTDNSIFRRYNPDFQFTSLEQGIQKTVDYFINNYENLRR
jgi:GDP-L-fucose synthase